MLSHRLDESLELTCLQRAQAEPLFALIQTHRAYLSHWLSWPQEIQSLEDTQSFIRYSLQQFVAGQTRLYALMFRGELVGICGCNAINKRLQRVRLGYWLAEPWQGQGIVTRACRWLIAMAFEQWQMAVVEIAVAQDNHRSRAVCERLGMQPTICIPQAEQLADRLVDHLIYTLSREQWLAGGEAGVDYPA